MAQPPYKTPEPVPHGVEGIPKDPPFTSGVTGFDDTFFGPNDKKFLDRKAKAMSNLRGIDLYYYKMKDQTQDIDGSRPLTDGPGPGPELEVMDAKTGPNPVRARSGNMSLYGEPVIVRNRIDSVKREVIPDWNYDDPILMRALAMEPIQEEDPDDRGTIFIYSLKLHVARILLDEAEIRPRGGDVIRLPKLLESYYDVKHVERDQHRFGAKGYFVAYTFDLVRNSMFHPERKLDGAG
jgi:hypothetical protein